MKRITEFGIFDVRGIQTNDSRKDTIWIWIFCRLSEGGKKTVGMTTDREEEIFSVFFAGFPTILDYLLHKFETSITN